MKTTYSGFRCFCCGTESGADFNGYTCPACGGNLEVRYAWPPGMGRGNEGQSSEKTTRTLQVTARPGANRGERQPI